MSDTVREPVVLDSVTHLEAKHRGAVAYCASHGGSYAAYYAAAKGVAALILSDAGIGRERAGVAGLDLLEKLGVPAAAISHRSARIGYGSDGVARGILSTVNDPAAALGLEVGMACRTALERLAGAGLPPAPAPAAAEEFRFEISEAGRGGVKVIVMDSISLVTPADIGHVIIAASHGGLLGGRPETAVKQPVFAAVVCDADRGIDDAGISRLPAMDARGIAGACVSAFSARIGDGRSLYQDGFISVVNDSARQHGGLIGQSCRDFVAAMVAARAGQIAKAQRT
jgi:hypothetical protein